MPNVSGTVANCRRDEGCQELHRTKQCPNANDPNINALVFGVQNACFTFPIGMWLPGVLFPFDWKGGSL